MRQASQETGVPLPTLSRWKKKGVFSADKNEDGSYSIDASELDRIKEIKSRRLTRSENLKPKTRHPETQMKPANDTGLQEQKIQHLQELLNIEKNQTAELKTDRDKWQRQAEKLLLTYQPQPPALSEKQQGRAGPIAFTVTEWVMIGLAVAIIIGAVIIKS